MSDIITPTVETKQEQKQEVKTFTQDEVNQLIGGAKTKAQEKILKDLGIDNIDNVKDALKRLKEKQEAEMTEVERHKKQNEELTKKLTEIENAKNTAETKSLMLMKGIDKDKIERALKLANTFDGETIDQKIDMMLKEYPEFIKSTVQIPNIGAPTTGQSVSELDKARIEMRKAMGLKV